MSQCSPSTMKPLYVAMQMVFLASTCLASKTVFAAENAPIKTAAIENPAIENPAIENPAIESTPINAASSAQRAQQLSTIVVTAAQDAVSEGSGIYTVNRANTATKLNLSLRDTPQAVKVYTRDYLDDRNIESFQALMNVIAVKII